MITLMFLLLLLGPLTADLYSRRAGDKTQVTFAYAALWSSIYISSAVVFAGFLWLWRDSTAATLFLSGYAIEKSLSIDNLIVFGAIFAYFGIPSSVQQYRVLHVGIIGSVILRLLFVSMGLAMFAIFGRVLDIAFGIFVIWTATKLDKQTDPGAIDHASRWYIRWTRYCLPVTGEVSDHFFVRTKRGWFDAVPTATPLFLCLIAIEFTDIAFAFDSVPAVIGVTREPILVYSAIMFAVVGLRSLFFVMEALLKFTSGLQAAIMVVLLFVGVKMLVHGIFNRDIPAYITLTVILLAIVVSAALSLINKKAVA